MLRTVENLRRVCAGRCRSSLQEGTASESHVFGAMWLLCCHKVVFYAIVVCVLCNAGNADPFKER